MNCHEGCQESADQNFLDKLNRLPSVTTEEQQNGLWFEDEVYKAASGKPRNPHPNWESGIRAVSDVIQGAQIQVRCSRELVIGEYTLLAYGILDALKAGTIFDVKFSNRSFGTVDLAGRYLHSPQHPEYFYLLPEARQFMYLVSDGVDLYTETYRASLTPSFSEIADEFLQFLLEADLMTVYKEKWEAL